MMLNVNLMIPPSFTGGGGRALAEITNALHDVLQTMVRLLGSLHKARTRKGPYLHQPSAWPTGKPRFGHTMLHYLHTNIVVSGTKINIIKQNLGMDVGHDYLIRRFSYVTSVRWNKHILTSKEVNISHRYYVNRSKNT